MHYRMFFSSDIWLTAADLFNEQTGKTREVTLTIDRVVKGHLVGVGGKRSTKPAIHWKERQKDGSPIKPLAVGAKCCAQIGQSVGSTDMSKWPGNKITLFVDEDRVSGEMRPCIRVRAFRADQQRASRGGKDAPPATNDMPNESAPLTDEDKAQIADIERQNAEREASRG